MATKPYEKWLTDVTEFKALDGKKCYLSSILILDRFNNEIIAYKMGQNPNFQQIQEMLQQAFRKLPKNANPILPSDQGWQYQMQCYQCYQCFLKSNSIQQNMSRKGNCLDNATMESFFGRLKTKCFYKYKFEKTEQAIHDYIRYYNEKRIQSVK
ncbi:integrase-like protein [Bisgaardia hudsonensis]|uniref:Integrase-like protein n=1 Tax=Bisgaardia hudsonensis TaxID=109472 RepID=A0A4R2N1S7_9PAST|nr:integrase-like protein [Bisgaardia hudsonensis]